MGHEHLGLWFRVQGFRALGVSGDFSGFGFRGLGV